MTNTTPPLSHGPAVIVLDGEHRAALAVVRSLGRHGYKIYVGSPVPRSISGASRFAVAQVTLPDPVSEPSEYVRAVDRLRGSIGAVLVHPVTDASILAILEQRLNFPALRTPYGSLDAFARACDKELVLRTAIGLGIKVPKQWTVQQSAGALPTIPEEAFPIVLKPHRSVIGGPGARTTSSVRFADTRSELCGHMEDIGSSVRPILLQQRIFGPGVGVFLIRWNGKVLATFSHRRIREKPPAGGVSVLSKSIELPPSLLAQAISLVEALDWEGVAMVEFKQDSATGEYYLMEINPRFWGSLQLAIDSGVDFPLMLTHLVLGKPISPNPRWTTGQLLRWGWGDIDHLLTRLRRSRRVLHVPPDSPGILRTALCSLTPWRPRCRGDVFRLNDLAPFARETLQRLSASAPARGQSPAAS